MLIDWFTVCAQIVNFLILVWLLKRFLYKPILAAIAAREKQIDGNLEEAQQKKTEAESALADLNSRLTNFERDKAQKLRQVEEAAEQERARMIGEAREEIKALRAKWQATLREEQDDLSKDVARRIQQEVFAIARKVLSELAGEPFEERMAEKWIGCLLTLDPEEKALISDSMQHAHGATTIRSAFNLSQPTRDKLVKAIHQELGNTADIDFSTVPELIGGIELNAEGRKISWTVAAALTALEKRGAELLAVGNITDGNDGQRLLASAGHNL